MDSNCYDLKLFKVRNSYFYVGGLQNKIVPVYIIIKEIRVYFG